MTDHDEFAKAAMQVIIIGLTLCSNAMTDEEIAKQSYRMADAMIAERRRRLSEQPQTVDPRCGVLSTRP